MQYKKPLSNFIILCFIISLAFNFIFSKITFTTIEAAAQTFLSQNKVQATTLLCNLEKYQASLCPEIILYYSTPDQSAIKAYTLCITNENKPISPLHEAFTSYTEGFIPTTLKQKLLTQINLQKHTALHYFYNIFEDSSYYTIATIGDLSHCYFISKTDHLVQTPITKDLPLEPFYINHLIQLGHTYYLLGDTVNAHSSHLYTLDCHTLQVTGHYTYQTSDSVIYSYHSALDALGRAYFIAPHGLDYTPLSLSYTAMPLQFLPLEFTPSYLTNSGHTTIALSLDGKTHLNYAKLTSHSSPLIAPMPTLNLTASSPTLASAASIPTLTQGILPLPDTSLQLVEAYYEDDLLYLLTLAPQHPLYTNYLLVYDLTTNHLIYCCGLENALPYMPTHFALSRHSIH